MTAAGASRRQPLSGRRLAGWPARAASPRAPGPGSVALAAGPPSEGVPPGPPGPRGRAGGLARCCQCQVPGRRRESLGVSQAEPADSARPGPTRDSGVWRRRLPAGPPGRRPRVPGPASPGPAPPGGAGGYSLRQSRGGPAD